MQTKTIQNSLLEYLKIEFPDFSGARKALVRHRNILCGLKHNSPQYKKELKIHFRLLIFVKAHALSLDTREERRRLLNLFMKEMEYIKFFK